MDPFADLGEEGGLPAAEGGFQDRLDPFAQHRVVAVARQEDEARHESFQRVAADEQGGSLAFLQVQDAHGDLRQVGIGDLVQLVAGIGVEDVGQGLGVVADALEIRAAQRPLHFLAQERDGARAGVVGRRGEQAHEHAFAGDGAIVVELLDDDDVQRHPPVHRRYHVGLGHQHQVRPADGVLDGRRQVGEVAAQAVEQARLDPAQHAEAAVLDDVQPGFLRSVDEAVVAEAEEREVVVVEPAQERNDLGHILGRVGGRAAFQMGDGVLQMVAHGPPVADGGADVDQHRLDLRLDLTQRLGRALLVHLDVHEALGDGPIHGRPVAQGGDGAGGRAVDLDHRVDDQMDGQPECVQRSGERVDEERHVVVDDLDDGVAGVPAVLVIVRVIGPDLGGTRRPLGAEMPEAEGGTVQVVGLLADDVVGRDVPVVEADEALRVGRLFLRQAVADETRDFLDQFRLLLFGMKHRLNLPVLRIHVWVSAVTERLT